MNDTVTEDWDKFGYREKKMGVELLNAWMDRKYARNILEMGDGVKVAFNLLSGYVFLTNNNYDAFMLDEDGNLDIFLHCPECGNEGFPPEMRDDPSCDKCKEHAMSFLE